MEELNKKIYILYGSATGNGESIAHILEQMLIEDLQQDVYSNTLNSIKNDIQSLHTKCKLLIVICSTTGNGDSPENASFFWNIIKKRSLPKDFLKKYTFYCIRVR
jgi:methionine synthase reductase